MKPKLLLVLFMLMTCLLAERSTAQTRYADSIFAGYTLDSVTYSVYGYKMNIYQPAGDVQATRPLVVLAHGGSFYTGDRYSDNTVTQLCADLAHKGYVTVSIDYTLIAHPGNFLNGDSAATEVLRAVGDGKAAVRYFYKDASSTNTYRIDTNNVFIGGNSAGAVLFMQYAYVDSAAQLSPALQQDLNNNAGGFQGNSGNPGYSTNFKAVINLAGGLNDPNYITRCSKPVVSAQGDSDKVVPYTCADPTVSGFPVPLQLCGLGSLLPFIRDNTPYHTEIVFPGDGHVPWATDLSKFYRVDTLITSFLYTELNNTAPTICPNPPAGIHDIAAATISLYPNPASNVLNIRSSQMISNIYMVDIMGHTIAQVSDVNNVDYQLNTSKLSTGVYFIRIYNGQNQIPVVRKVTIE